MKIAIMQPYFMPYVGYWQLINEVDTFVIFDDVNFMKKSWINRNHILVNGEAYLFSLSILKQSQNKLINELYLSDNQDKFLRSIELAYKKAPCYDEVFPLIQKICAFPDGNLARFIGNSLIELAGFLGLSTRFIYSSEISKDNSLKGQDKIIEICKQLGAVEYINPIGGTELYDKTLFKEQGIELHFLKSEPMVYKQFTDNYIPWLSIIDILMFNSSESLNSMLNNYFLL